MKKNTKLIATLFSVLLVGLVMSSFTGSTRTLSHSAVIEQSTLNSAGMNAPPQEIPPFNLEVILRGEGKSFGHVKFRQENDAAKIIDLGVWVRDLEPNHAYYLERAAEGPADGICSSNSWLRLGLGTAATPILTDDRGTGQADLWRNVSALPTGATFDIHFHVIDAVTSAEVLTSDCYQYVVR
jgi:hypothetical protein